VRATDERSAVHPGRSDGRHPRRVGPGSTVALRDKRVGECGARDPQGAAAEVAQEQGAPRPAARSLSA
jgi:hypothetical protein